ncbi:hypothetical protein GCM10029978_025560 [Actinoallomurus acanthiterrae]
MRATRHTSRHENGNHPVVALTLIVGYLGFGPLRSLRDLFRHPEFPDRTAPASTYPWVEPDHPSAVEVAPPDGFLDALVVDDVIVMTERTTDVPGRTGARGLRVRGVDPKGRTLFTGRTWPADSGRWPGPGLRLLGEGRRTRVAFTNQGIDPGGRSAYVDIYDPAARGDVQPQTVRFPTDEELQWAGGTAIQVTAGIQDGPSTILDADGMVSPWHRSGRRPVAATGDVVVDVHRSEDGDEEGFQVVDRRTRRVLWSRRGQTVYAVSTHAVIAGRTRRLRLYDLKTGKVVARSRDPLAQGGTTSSADITRRYGDVLMTWQVAGSTRHRWVHGGWNVGDYAIWQDDVYGFQSPENPFDENPMALWIPPDGTPAKFPVSGRAAPLGVTTDGLAVALTGTFRDRALYVLPLRG